MKVFIKITSIVLMLMSSIFIANAMEEQDHALGSNWQKEYHYEQKKVRHPSGVIRYIAPSCWTITHTPEAVIVKTPLIKGEKLPTDPNTVITDKEIIETQYTGFKCSFCSLEDLERNNDPTFVPEGVAILRTQFTQREFEEQIGLLQAAYKQKGAGGILFLPIIPDNAPFPDNAQSSCVCVML